MTTLKQCRVKIDRLRAEIRTIEVQLADRNKLRDGRRMTGEQYTAWRKNALRAMNAKLEQLREANRAKAGLLSDIKSGVVDIDRSDPDSLLAGCYMAHEKIKSTVGADSIDPSILVIFDLVRDRVLGID